MSLQKKYEVANILRELDIRNASDYIERFDYMGGFCKPSNISVKMWAKLLINMTVVSDSIEAQNAIMAVRRIFREEDE